MARKFIVTAPVIDLRGAPQEIVPQDYSHQDLRETQLLFGETLTCSEDRGEWLKVFALEQPIFDTQKGWHTYTGWVKRSEVKEVERFDRPTHVLKVFNSDYSYGTYFSKPHPLSRPLPSQPNRKEIIEEALLFLGRPYLWGGRSFYTEASSVDCSGLINLLYRAQGLLIPRNAHDQYLRSQFTPHLQPGDPLFLCRTERISHVILKLNDETFIESPETGKEIRLLHWGKDIWQEGKKIHIFDRPQPYTPFPRTFI